MKIQLNYLIEKPEEETAIAHFLLSRGYSSRLIVSLRNTPGSFLVNGVPAFSNRELKAGDRLAVFLNEPEGSGQIVPVPMDFSILFEDEHLMVIDKPPGMPVHPSQGNYGNTLANGIAWHQKEAGGPFVFRAVNRLDKDTSGLLLVAKHRLSSCILSEQVKHHQIHREYLAIACGKTDRRGTISLPISRKEGSAIERVPDPEHGEAAVTHYVTLAYSKDTDLSFLRLKLETGRTHQIRVHMKAIGHPLPGDFLYHPDYRYIKRQALHSASLRFVHPITREAMEFQAPLPEDMARLFPEMGLKAAQPFGVMVF